MNVDDLTHLLGYNDSPSYLPKSKFSRYPGYSQIFRRAQKDCSLHGVYILGGHDSNSAIPVVYVCEVGAEDEAAKLHKKVWNQNIVPFIIVSTPKSFRLYPGFKYKTDAKDSETQAILNVSKTANNVLTKFSEFKAEAINFGHVWEKWGKEVSVDSKVDRRLLETLKKLGNKFGSARHLAHNLIGKYVYLHYLRNRNILSDRKFEQWGIESESVFGRNATLNGFFRTIEMLEEWLNGELFPITKSGKNAPSFEQLQLVASTFAGDDPITGQMHLDFKAYDFEYIPTETLSVVYQQFLHAEGRERRQGAYYTPVHLVNFILDGLDAKIPLRKGMTVFDPACGSGAFLVQCYRVLIERELALTTENHLRPSELRNLLTQHIYGLDIDKEACGVTELSLTLTLLDYVNPPDLEKACYKKFRLPKLRNRNVFYCKNGFFSPSPEFLINSPKKGFDWIVGNPPWKKISQKSEDGGDKAALNWIWNHKKQFPVSDNQLAEAFAWAVTERISKQGLIGLMMPASTLFKTKALNFRKHFFSKNNVWCVVNFSNLRHMLFEGAVNPLAAFFYRCSINEDEKPSRITSYAPFAVNQFIRFDRDQKNKSKLWTITVDASEIGEIQWGEAVTGSSLPWKIAMWGSFRDSRLLNSIQKSFPSLSQFKDRHELIIHPGLELRDGNNAEEPIEHIPKVAGKFEIDMNALRGCGRIFSFPMEALKTIKPSRAYVRKGRGIKPVKICRPPHIIVDAARRFTVFSDEFIVVPPRQIGISAEPFKANLLKALSLYLSSEFVLYQQFLSSTFWGVERDRPDKDDLEAIPIPIGNLSEPELKTWAKLHDEIVNEEQKVRRNLTNSFKSPNENVRLKKLIIELNRAVFNLLQLTESEKWLIEDLLRVRIKLNEGRSPVETLRPAKESEVQTYAEILRMELDSFLDNKKLNQHTVTVYYSDQLAMVRIERPKTPSIDQVSAFKVQDSEIEKEFSRISQNLSNYHAQWIYFKRNLKYYEGRTTYFFKPIRRLHWLKSQALLDADEFIAEKLR